MKKITLNLNGRSTTYLKKDLIEVADSYLSVAEKFAKENTVVIKPHDIDFELFKDERQNSYAEAMRQMILKAIEQRQIAPEKYGKSFEFVRFPNSLQCKTLKMLKESLRKMGMRIANEVEIAFEWAHYISRDGGNEESWRAICDYLGSQGEYCIVNTVSFYRDREYDYKLLTHAELCDDDGYPKQRYYDEFDYDWALGSINVPAVRDR